MALLGDLGGVTEVITLAMGVILFPIAESSYNMMSTKRMFLERTKDHQLFNEADDKKKKKWFLTDKALSQDIKNKLR